MAQYLVQASYTGEALGAMVSNPQDRKAGAQALLERFGATLDSFHFAFGEYDVVAVYTAPDDTTAAAIALAICAPGHLRSYKTTRLLSADEFLAAAKQAQGAGYTAPSAR